MNSRIPLTFLLVLFLLPSIKLYSQSILPQGFIPGEVHGNFQSDLQYYNSDTSIGAPEVPEKVLMRGFANINYTLGNFSAGLRYESYLATLQGFDSRYDGNAIPYRYATYQNEKLNVTVGSFYEQFGNGLIFRSYEQWGLGYDNAMDGIRLKYEPLKGVYLKGVIGKLRKFMGSGPGVVRGLDLEFSLADMFDSLFNKTNIIIGGGMISKYQSDQNSTYNLPENVAAFAGRLNIISGKFNIGAEYAYKINDPSAANSYIYKDGESFLFTASYSTKGLGILLTAKRVDNMDFRSDRAAAGSELNINYIPAITKVHTYSLAAYYPYATQPLGEMGLQGDIIYKIKKGSPLGGKYGTSILVNYSTVFGIKRTAVNDTTAIGESGTLGYKSNFFDIGDTKYFEDLNINISRKFSKKFKAAVSFMYFEYNKDVIQGFGNQYGTIYGNVAVADLTFKLKPKNTIRVELQNLYTKQDDGSWGMMLVEYTIAPHWFVAAFDEYNYGNKKSNKRFHYFTAQVGYKNKGNTFTLGYGRQRAGIFCVGGVCRNVPASNGVTLAITSSF